MQVWAGVRRGSSRAYLQDSRIHFLELDFSSKDRLVEQLDGHEFDYVVHAAGVTKCINKDDFFKVNTQGTRNLVDALLALQMPLKRFVYLSSLSVFGPVAEEQPYREITDEGRTQPTGRASWRQRSILTASGTSSPISSFVRRACTDRVRKTIS